MKWNHSLKKVNSVIHFLGSKSFNKNAMQKQNGNGKYTKMTMTIQMLLMIIRFYMGVFFKNVVGNEMDV